MRKKIFLAVPLVLLIAFFVGYYTFNHIYKQISDDKGSEINSPKVSPLENKNTEDEIYNEIKNMTLDEKIGQMVIAGIDKYSFDSNAESLLKDYNVGGFIILNQNAKNASQLLKLVNDIKTGNSKSNIPLFLSID